MKNIKPIYKWILALTFLFGGQEILIAQEVDNPPEVFVENEWYLTKLVIDGEDRLFVPDEDIHNVYLEFDNVVSNDEGITGAIETYFCDADWAQFTLEGEEDLYTEGWNTLARPANITNCGLEPITDNRATEFLYFNVFWMNNQDGTYETYHYQYIISQNETAKELIITNDEGNKAYFQNIPLSVQDFDKDKLVLYPNPLQDRLYLENLTKPVEIEIYSLSGKVLLHQEVDISTGQVNVSQLSEGIYLYQLSQNGRKVKTGKLVKN